MSKIKTDVYSLIKLEVEKLEKLGFKTASLDCRLILSQILEKSNPVYTHEQVNISKNEIINFRRLVKQREKGKPVSRILNKRNFWKREFMLNEETLDPRPDSEILIEAVLEHFPNKSQLLKILDLGSGTGCLGLSLSEEYEDSEISFADISKKSLEIVEKNSRKFRSKARLKYINLDWYTYDWDVQLLNFERKVKYDIIISNPPYIPSNEIKFLETEVKDYDPTLALDGGNDGLSAYRYIIPRLKNIVKSDGKIFFEIGKGQKDVVSQIALQHGLISTDYKRDLSNIIRVIIFNSK